MNRLWPLIVGVLLVAPAPKLRAQPYHDPDASKFVIRNLETINSSSDDYAPYVTPSGRWLYFTSSRDGSADMFRSGLEADVWTAVAAVADSGVNTRRDDGALNVATPNLAQLYDLDATALSRMSASTVGVMTGGRRDDGNGDADVYLLDISYDGSKISNVRHPLGINSEDWDSQPTIAPDGSFIIFSSARSGGYGDKDLYISTRDVNGNYGIPVNLGMSINSDGNDVSPYLAPDGKTLFFASDGRDGFGGADIFVSRRNDQGEWSVARNLGEKINTSANELFFFGASRARCLFASDRNGGKGGFDIYEATPNIFAPGYSLMQLTVRDTVTGKGVPGRVKIIELSQGRTILDREIDPSGNVELPVLSGFNYRVEVTPNGFAAVNMPLADFPSDTVFRTSIAVASAPPPPPPPPPLDEPAVAFTCKFEDRNIPMFVSGYYRLNTPQLLADLRQRQKGGNLQSHTYITDIANDPAAFERYEKMSRKVEKELQDCYETTVMTYLPQYVKFLAAAKPNEHLEITVYGYADPRPIIGVYAEDKVSFLDPQGRTMSVSAGEELDNVKLAGLRAFYAREYLDTMFSDGNNEGNRAYRKLRQENRIQWKVVSGGVDGTKQGNQQELNRRIMIEFRRVGNE